MLPLARPNYAKWVYSCLFRYSGVGPACGALSERGLGEAEAKEVLDYHNRLEDS